MAGPNRRPARPAKKNCGCAQNGPSRNSNARKAYKIARRNGDEQRRIDVLCQCGWGRLSCPLNEVPEFCPMCGVDLRELLGDPADRFADDDAPEYMPPVYEEEVVDDDDLNRNGPRKRRNNERPKKTVEVTILRPKKTVVTLDVRDEDAWKERGGVSRLTLIELPRRMVVSDLTAERALELARGLSGGEVSEDERSRHVTPRGQGKSRSVGFGKFSSNVGEEEVVDDDDLNRNGGDKLLRDLKRAADKGDHLARLRYVQEAQRRGVLVPGSGVLKRGDPVTVINEKNKHFGRTGTVVDLNRGTVDVVLDDGTPVSTQRSMLAKGGVVGAFSRRKKNPPLETIQDIQKAWKELIDEGTPPVVAKQIILRELRPPKNYEKDQAGSDRRQSQIREWLDRESAGAKQREEKNKEKIAARNGRRAVSTKRTKLRRNSLDVLREIDVDGYRLLTWDAHRMRDDKDMIGYRFTSPSGQVIFEGEDFGNSPLHAKNSDQTLRYLLGFLTLRPGSTDRDWFDGYTPEQREFAATDAERLSLYAEADGPPLVDVDGSSDDD